MTILPAAGIPGRRAIIEESETLRSIGRRMDAHLDPLRAQPIALPPDKPLLSRDGGTCPTDGARLRFHPLRPHDHECPDCETTVRGSLHDRAWSWRYHVWLSERAVHAALLHALGVNRDGAQLCAAILDAYTDRYWTYANRDNVLGPSRMFFSTYLESIWLLQLVGAASLVRSVGAAPVPDRFDDLVRASVDLVRSFDEGWSNRQVWNNAAMIAAGLYQQDDDLVRHGLTGPHGILSALDTVVSRDGRWIEGENYHFFALHGLQFVGEQLHAAGHTVWSDSVTSRLGPMYRAPLDTLLPDLTFPARGDSPFGVSVAQPRFAQLWEVARARTDERRIDAVLEAIYQTPGPAEDLGLVEITEVETHRPPTGVSREALGWKMLAWGRPDPPPVDTGRWDGGTRVVGEVGPVIIRPSNTRYVSIETGSGSGHGHPDALHLSVYDDGLRLADPGTASYVTPSLFWYRSTLAHNAPTVPGRGQYRSAGWCSAAAESGQWAWARVELPEAAGPGTHAQRVVVAAPGYLLDLVRVEVPPGVTIDLPLHPLGELDALPGEPVAAAIAPRAAGYDALSDVARVAGAARTWMVCDRSGRRWQMHIGDDDDVRYVAWAPGPPSLEFADGAMRASVIRRLTGTGAVHAAISDPGVLTEIEQRGDEVVVSGPGFEDRYRFSDDGVDIGRSDGGSVRLAGCRTPPEPAPIPRVEVPHVWCPILDRSPRLHDWLDRVPWNAVHRLGEPNYRRSETPYPGDGEFAARFAMWASGKTLCFAVDVHKPVCVFLPETPGPRLDNDPPEIHADGVQFYWSAPAPGAARDWNGVIVVPGGPEPRLQPVTLAAPDPATVRAAWSDTARGYSVLLTVDVGRRIRPGDRFRMNVAINEMRPERERRAGQLVFVGGGGWVYLRGDREPIATAAVAEVR